MTTYHLSQDGDDAADGRSPERAWRSLERIPCAELQPGDSVLLRAGDGFHGQLRLIASGAPERPITLGAWGPGRARIHVPPGANGVELVDAGHLVLRDLEIAGPGVTAAAQGDGIAIRALARRSADVRIVEVACHDFPGSGINLWAEDHACGCDDVLVERVACSGCGEAGMSSWGDLTPDCYGFQRLRVRDSVFHGNRGRVDKRDNHSGNGIVLGACRDALIERCAAWGNGDLCRSSVGGPVGIWLCESDRSTIRNCLSFRNRTGEDVPDGGGFDLDGGCTGCLIEDCLSWRNDGAGYLVYQYQDARPLRGNLIRNCFSIGDGRGRNNAGIYVGAMPAGDVHELTVERCTVVIDDGPSRPAAVRLTGPVDDFRFHANLFVTLGGARLLDDAAPGGSRWSGNRWCAVDGEALFVGADGPLPPPADDRIDPGAIALAATLPDRIDAAWLEPLALDGVGASPLPRYGPAPLPDHSKPPR